ncbi:MAG: vacuolar iron transporter family protein [Mycobacterium sp.]|nr:vacuolar iron transporter family protein [Mycobacterium sp.]
MPEDNSLQPSPAQVAAAAAGAATHRGEPHAAGLGSRLNWLRAGVLGANDGIVSVAGLVVGVAGATLAWAPILTAGLAGLVAGAVSMALGEYVSVSSQRDTELAELTAIYQAKKLTPATAHTVAQELTAHNALTAHLDAELKLDPEQLTKPGHAAASALSSLSVRCYHWWRFCSHPPVGEYPSPSSRSWSPWPSPGRSVPASAPATPAARSSASWSAAHSASPSPTASATCSAPP